MAEDAAQEKKEKRKKKVGGFFKEFKDFISRGNVMELAIGIIIGGAFTAIVTALCDNVLKPVINWILALIVGKNGLNGIYTYLSKAYVIDAETGLATTQIDLANSIYIDWGSLINAIINFLLIALVLFIIIKVINKLHKLSVAAKESAQSSIEKHKEEREAKKKALEEAEKKESEGEGGVAKESAAPPEGETPAPVSETGEAPSEAPNEE